MSHKVFVIKLINNNNVLVFGSSNKIKTNVVVPTKKFENNFSIKDVKILIHSEDLKGIFTLDIYKENVLKIRFNDVTLTTVNKVKGVIKGYAKSIKSL